MTQQIAALIAKWRERQETYAGPTDWGQAADELDALAAACVESAPSAWQPIDTAPKDGTSVLLAYKISDLACVTVGWFTCGRWRDEENTDLGPTHWMLLPDPPTMKHESRSPDGDSLTTSAEIAHGDSNGRPKNLHDLGEGASANARQVTEAGSEPADSHQPLAAEAAAPRPIAPIDEIVERALGFVAEFKGDPRCALNCLHAEALASEIHHQRQRIATLTADRDKWLDRFNRSEQFQNGPTKRAEAAEQQIASLTAERDREHGLRQTNWAYQQDLIAHIEAERDTWKTLAAKLAGLSGDHLLDIAPEPAQAAYRDLPDLIEKRQA